MMKRILLTRTIGGDFKIHITHAGVDIMHLIPDGAFYAFNDVRTTKNIFLVIRAWKEELNKYAFNYLLSNGGPNGGK